jgi:hypothetical protein
MKGSWLGGRLIASALRAYLLLFSTLGLANISAVMLCIKNKALEPVTQQQSLSVVLCLRNQGQQHVSQITLISRTRRILSASAKSTISAIEGGFSSV